MESFKEFLNKKIEEAALPKHFDEIIKSKGTAGFKKDPDAFNLAVEIVKRASEELRDEFMGDANDEAKDSISLNSQEYKDLAIAIDVLAANKNSKDKAVKTSATSLLNKLEITPETGTKIVSHPVIKKIRKSTKPILKATPSEEPAENKETETPQDKETPKTTEEPKATETPEEKPTEEPKATETPEEKPEETPKTTEEPKISKETEGQVKRSKETQRTVKQSRKGGEVSDKDEKSPAYFETQAKEKLQAAIEKMNTASEGASDVKKMKMKKVITDMEKSVNKKIHAINKQQQGYSNHSNFSTRLKATTNAKNLTSEIGQIINASTNKAKLKGMDTGLERLAGRAKEAGEAVKSGVEKVTKSRRFEILKDKAAEIAKKGSEKAKRGAEVAAPVIKRTADKVASKIKTEVDDVVVKKWSPDKFKEFVSSDDPAKQAEILAGAKAERQLTRDEASKKRRLAKQKKTPAPPLEKVMPRKGDAEPKVAPVEEPKAEPSAEKPAETAVAKADAQPNNRRKDDIVVKPRPVAVKQIAVDAIKKKKQEEEAAKQKQIAYKPKLPNNVRRIG